MSKFLTLIAVCVACGYTYTKISADKGVKFPMRVISQSTEAKSVPADERIRVLLFTGTEWCPACMNLDKAVIKTDEWKEFAKQEIRFHSFDFPVDRSRVPKEIVAVASQYGIDAYPTMLVLDRDNEIISRQVGSGPPVENYKSWIRKHAKFYQAPKAENADELANVETPAEAE